MSTQKLRMLPALEIGSLQTLVVKDLRMKSCWIEDGPKAKDWCCHKRHTEHRRRGGGPRGSSGPTQAAGDMEGETGAALVLGCADQCGAISSLSTVPPWLRTPRHEDTIFQLFPQDSPLMEQKLGEYLGSW